LKATQDDVVQAFLISKALADEVNPLETVTEMAQ